MYIYYQEIPIPLLSGNFGPLLEIVMQFVSANTLKLLQGISVDVYDTVKMYIFQGITIPLFSGNFDPFEFRIYVLEAKGLVQYLQNSSTGIYHSIDVCNVTLSVQNIFKGVSFASSSSEISQKGKHSHKNVMHP